MYQAKFKPFLQTNHVLRADGIRAPQRFVKVFAVPAAEFRGAVVNIIEWTATFEHPFQLAKVADITAGIKRHFDVRAQAKADLIWLMLHITRNDMMASRA